MTQYFINSIYLGTEGEGIHVGTPQVFVRFQGCTVGCVNCDSKDTWEFKQFRTWDVSEIIAEVIRVGHQGKIKRVSITGGDPLHPKNVPAVTELAATLKNLNYFVNLEAAGTRIVHEIFDRVDFISFDYKTPSTEVVTKIDLIETLYAKYPNRFQIKAVVSDERDFKSTLAAQNELALRVKINQAAWVLTPCFNVEENFPQERFQKVVAWNELEGAPFRVIGQQHKWIHGPAKKFV